MCKIYKSISFRDFASCSHPSGLRPGHKGGLEVAPKPPVWKFVHFKSSLSTRLNYCNTHSLGYVIIFGTNLVNSFEFQGVIMFWWCIVNLNGAFLLPIKCYHLEFQSDIALFPIDFNLLVNRVFHIEINWNYNFVGLFTPPRLLQLVWALSDHCSQLLNFFVWPRITDDVSLPEMRIWSILLIQSDLKWCIHPSRSLFLYSDYVLALGLRFNLLSSSDLLRLRIRVLRFWFGVYDKGFRVRRWGSNVGLL